MDVSFSQTALHFYSGALKDVTGNFHASYYFAAAASTAASIIFMCNLQDRDRHCAKIMKRKEKGTLTDGNEENSPV